MIFGGLFDFDKKEEEIKKLEEITKESNFWYKIYGINLYK